jgi:hypothetical protein
MRETRLSIKTLGQRLSGEYWLSYHCKPNTLASV